MTECIFKKHMYDLISIDRYFRNKTYVNLCTSRVDLELTSNGRSIEVVLHSVYICT